MALHISVSILLVLLLAFIFIAVILLFESSSDNLNCPEKDRRKEERKSIIAKREKYFGDFDETHNYHQRLEFLENLATKSDYNPDHEFNSQSIRIDGQSIDELVENYVNREQFLTPLGFQNPEEVPHHTFIHLSAGLALLRYVREVKGEDVELLLVLGNTISILIYNDVSFKLNITYNSKPLYHWSNKSGPTLSEQINFQRGEYFLKSTDQLLPEMVFDTPLPLNHSMQLDDLLIGRGSLNRYRPPDTDDFTPSERQTFGVFAAIIIPMLSEGYKTTISMTPLRVKYDDTVMALTIMMRSDSALADNQYVENIDEGIGEDVGISMPAATFSKAIVGPYNFTTSTPFYKYKNGDVLFILQPDNFRLVPPPLGLI